MRNQTWSCVYRNQQVCHSRNIAFVIETSQVLLRSHSACPSTWHSTRRKTPKCTTPTNCTDFYKQATKIPPRPTSSKTSRGHPRRYPRQETLPDRKSFENLAPIFGFKPPKITLKASGELAGLFFGANFWCQFTCGIPRCME